MLFPCRTKDGDLRRVLAIPQKRFDSLMAGFLAIVRPPGRKKRCRTAAKARCGCESCCAARPPRKVESQPCVEVRGTSCREYVMSVVSSGSPWKGDKFRPGVSPRRLSASVCALACAAMPKVTFSGPTAFELDSGPLTSLGRGDGLRPDCLLASGLGLQA